MGMKGILVGLSPERRRILESEPTIVHDLADRSVDVPGRLFFDALRLPERLRARRREVPSVVLACLQGELGRGVGGKSGWAFGRPHVIEGEELGALVDALALLPKHAPTDDPLEGEAAAADDALLQRLAEIVRRERDREGALLVHVT